MGKTRTSFQQGESGNLNGRPKKEWTMRGEIIKALERQTADGTPLKQGVAEALVDKALQGDVMALKEIGNRIDGMPVQKNVLAGDNENPIKLELGPLLKKVYGQTAIPPTGEVPTDS